MKFHGNMPVSNPCGKHLLKIRKLRLMEIDLKFFSLQILATKGHEGSALHEFCRPSGTFFDKSYFPDNYQ